MRMGFCLPFGFIIHYYLYCSTTEKDTLEKRWKGQVTKRGRKRAWLYLWVQTILGFLGLQPKPFWSKPGMFKGVSAEAKAIEKEVDCKNGSPQRAAFLLWWDPWSHSIDTFWCYSSLVCGSRWQAEVLAWAEFSCGFLHDPSGFCFLLFKEELAW